MTSDLALFFFRARELRSIAHILCEKSKVKSTFMLHDRRSLMQNGSRYKAFSYTLHSCNKLRDP